LVPPVLTSCGFEILNRSISSAVDFVISSISTSESGAREYVVRHHSKHYDSHAVTRTGSVLVCSCQVMSHTCTWWHAHTCLIGTKLGMNWLDRVCVTESKIEWILLWAWDSCHEHLVRGRQIPNTI
jgi:hypothetical protein